MEHAKIVQKVRDILNEHGGDDGLSIGTDRVLLEEYIESAIPDAVIMLAQKGYKVNVADFTVVTDEGITIPDDYISLIVLKLDTWARAVEVVHSVESPQVIMAQNTYTAPKANTPICWREGDLLKCLPVGKTIGVGEYNVTYDGADLNAEPKEATAVCYMAAALVLGIFGDDEGKQRLSDVATNMLS